MEKEDKITADAFFSKELPSGLIKQAGDIYKQFKAEVTARLARPEVLGVEPFEIATPVPRGGVIFDMCRLWLDEHGMIFSNYPSMRFGDVVSTADQKPLRVDLGFGIIKPNHVAYAWNHHVEETARLEKAKREEKLKQENLLLFKTVMSAIKNDQGEHIINRGRYSVSVRIGCAISKHEWEDNLLLFRREMEKLGYAVKLHPAVPGSLLISKLTLTEDEEFEDVIGCAKRLKEETDREE